MWIPTKQQGVELIRAYRERLEADEGLKTLRARLSEIIPGMNWVIAGGAIRDVILGRDPRDYDVFVLWSRAGLARTLSEAGIPILPCEDGKPRPLAEFEHNGKKVQIMARKGRSADSIIENFDFNICMVGWDNIGWIHAYVNLFEEKMLRMNEVLFPCVALRRALDFVSCYELQFSHDDQVLLVNAAFKSAYDNADGVDTGYEDPLTVFGVATAESAPPEAQTDIPY